MINEELVRIFCVNPRRVLSLMRRFRKSGISMRRVRRGVWEITKVGNGVLMPRVGDTVFVSASWDPSEEIIVYDGYQTLL